MLVITDIVTVSNALDSYIEATNSNRFRIIKNVAGSVRARARDVVLMGLEAAVFRQGSAFPFVRAVFLPPGGCFLLSESTREF